MLLRCKTGAQCSFFPISILHLVPLRIVVGVGVQVEADDFETVLFIKRDGVFIARLRL